MVVGKFASHYFQDGIPVVFMDLETTDLIRKGVFPNLIEIGGVTGDGKETFHTFVKPTKPVKPGATKVNHVKTDSQLNLYRITPHGERPITCAAENQKEGIQRFLDWLRTVVLRGCKAKKKVALVAYNGSKFDFKLIQQASREAGLETEMESLVQEYYDPLADFNLILPADVKKSMAAVMKYYGVQSSAWDGKQAHNAVNDAEDLRHLLVSARAAVC